MADQKSRFSLFGFRIGKKEDEQKQELIQPSFTPPSNEDGALTITSAAQFGTSALDLDGSAKNEIELITRYREMAMQPEVESAIEDVVNEAIVRNDDGKNVEIVLDDLKQSDKIKKAIREEFDTILKLLNYDNMGTDLFRRYYVDGRLFYHIIVDIESPQKGIQELRYIDPRKIRKIREVKKQKDSVSGVEVITKVNEYYVFAERVTTGPTNSPIGGVKIAPDSILNVNSGLMDAKRGMVLSYLHKAIKPLNQLRMIEDAVVIYRLSRAPERRVFYVDVGNLPRIKAEQYVRDIMTKYKNKLVYDACLDLNTMIPLMDGRSLLLKEIIIEYKEGKELWAYSCNPETGEFAPGLITWAGVTKLDQQVVRVVLENRKEIICTLDHKFPVWDKGFVEAKDLDYDDVLMTFDGQNDSDKEKGMKVVEMEILKETMNVGTLTIDGEEIHHDYHTFALDVGVYTKNSTGEVRDDRRHLCLKMDTKVPLLDGRMLTLEEISKEYKEKELWAYSCNPETGEFAPGLITWAGVSNPNAKIMRVTLDNGKTIDCTPEHRFPVWEQGMVEAKDLKVGDSMIPFYSKEEVCYGKAKYPQIFENKSKKWEFTHRLVSDWKDKNGLENEFIFNEEIAKGKLSTVHHINSNRFDNSPENLVRMHYKDHFTMHSFMGTSGGSISGPRNRDNGVGIFNKNHPDYLNWKLKSGEKGRKILAELIQDPEWNAEFRQKQREGWTEEKKEVASGHAKRNKLSERGNAAQKEQWQTPERKKKHNEMYAVEYTIEMFDAIKKLINGNSSKEKIAEALNTFDNLLETWVKVNENKCLSPAQKSFDKFTKADVDKIVRKFSGTTFADLKTQAKFRNHKIAKIEYLEERADTGCLTIDGDEKYHNYHTFALEAGIYTQNSMTEDFWMPRRSDNKSTEITTLPGGQNLSNLEDVQYFEKKLYKSLNVPVSRLDPQQAVSIGRSTEITRDELKFSRFIDKLRSKFSELFDNALRVQLILKGICTEEEWKEFKEDISYDFIKDNKFVELKEAELMQERLGILAIIDQYSGKYYSKHWIQKNVLRLKDIEIEQMEQQIDQEKEVDFVDQSEDQQKQIQLQAQAMQLQNELMPQQEPQIDANAPEEEKPGQTDAARTLHNTEREQIKGKKPNNPYHIQQ